MLKAIFLAIFGVTAGMCLALVLVIAVELFSSVVHPVPEDFGNTPEEMCRHVERYPAWVLAVVVPLWGLSALASTWTARKIGRISAALIVGTLLVAAAAFNLWMLPYPIWFKVAIAISIPIASVAGSRLATGQIGAFAAMPIASERR
ncbi:MAG: hypothetical protein AB7O62_17555 [Pirellulales bacterium]